MTATVAIYLFPDVEVLDFAGPYEVFTTASRVARKLDPAAAEPFSVMTVAREPGPVRARAGLRVIADATFDRLLPPDVLLIPGGVVTVELQSVEVIDWLRSVAGSARLTASVCTGAFLLARAGLLEGRACTTHWEDAADLRAMFPGLDVREGRRWVDEGAVVTSAGISAGIDMSLHLVARLAGRELALATARQMEVDWHEDGATPTMAATGAAPASGAPAPATA
ncbi:DJ-1/PfpI family protein [Derxia gummosa]|uniref:DJ-1/PfpI family protein n=1 Tax=Derxia gummosa DSM 723 TaxID=1121388 RepID=A0A8B6X9E4_9BURK|nr:DJ-1/PfpI family protein [Derxia gummosa]